ncbi:MAG: GNAT family N-acetyltransferase [Chloroflexales bacterium]|nr:GNAT family N-acetyltransferase [Chloroflexales bacterium]
MLTLRRYQPSDQEAVWELHTVALVQTNAYISSGAWDEDLHHIEDIYFDGGEFMVGVLDDRIVAMGALRRTTAERAAIKRMRVHPDHQGRGYGQTILTYLEERARALGYKTLYLSTTDRQQAAQGLYLKNGYHEVARKPLDDRTLIYYERDLLSCRDGS